jgi:hypothetical protein
MRLRESSSLSGSTRRTPRFISADVIERGHIDDNGFIVRLWKRRNNNMTLTRDEIFARRAALPTAEVDIPEMDGTVIIRLLTLSEVEVIKRIQKAADDPIKMYLPMVEKSCINADGTQMFVGEDVKLIGTLPWAAIERIVEASMKLSKLIPETPENGVPKD